MGHTETFGEGRSGRPKTKSSCAGRQRTRRQRDCTSRAQAHGSAWLVWVNDSIGSDTTPPRVPDILRVESSHCHRVGRATCRTLTRMLPTRRERGSSWRRVPVCVG